MSVIWTPQPHQSLATSFVLEHPRCNLWAVPGMGKTAIVYAVLDILKLAGSSFFPVLVIAPKAVCEGTWPAEQQKWHAFADLRVVPILGERDVRDAALMRRGDVFLINYDNVQWLVKQFGLTRWPFKVVVADESTRLKNFRLRGGGVRSTALASIAHHTGRWINLSGTPAPNGYKDLWGQCWFLDFGARLGRTYTQYMNRWFFENAYTRAVELRHPDCQKEIDAKIADITLAMRAEDWLDIHEPHVIPREVDLPPAARQLYDRMEREFFVELANLKEITAVNSAALSMKLLQIASGAVYDEKREAHYLHDAKVEGLRSIINEMGGEPLLVAYWFKFEIPMLKHAFPKMRVYDGIATENEWNKGRIDLMAVQPASAGHGVNLQFGGRAMAHFTHTWDLELRQQVCERIGPVRQKQAGFDRAVLHFNLIARNTLDIEVLERTATKRSVQDSLMLAQSRRGT